MESRERADRGVPAVAEALGDGRAEALGEGVGLARCSQGAAGRWGLLKSVDELTVRIRARDRVETIRAVGVERLQQGPRIVAAEVEARL